MILVDTSVWVHHLRGDESGLMPLLNAKQVLGHPFVLGEIALGSLQQRQKIIDLLCGLPQANCAQDAEVVRLIELECLHGLGIGWVDVHLLASLRLTPGSRLWTRDRRLQKIAGRRGLSFSAVH